MSDTLNKIKYVMGVSSKGSDFLNDYMEVMRHLDVCYKTERRRCLEYIVSILSKKISVLSIVLNFYINKLKECD